VTTAWIERQLHSKQSFATMKSLFDEGPGSAKSRPSSKHKKTPHSAGL
jgi:hypothetical protein